MSTPPPPTPSPPAEGGTALSVVSGEDGRPVAGATLVVSGQSAAGPFTQTLTSDASGRVVLDRQVLFSPTPLVDITAPAFVNRNTLLRSAEETQFSLWPRTSATGLDESTSATLVYSPSTCPAQNTGAAPLHRVGSNIRQIDVASRPGVQDAGMEAAHRSAIGLLNSAIGSAVAYSFAGAATGSAVSFLIDIRDSLLVLHELGHTYGFYHSPSTRDVMYCTVVRPADFSRREIAADGPDATAPVGEPMARQRPTGGLAARSS